MSKENIPENIQLLTARLIEKDFLSQANREKSLKQFFIDLNRCESHIKFEDKTINLQSLLNDNTRHLLENNKNFQQLYILEITKQLGNVDPARVEQALSFLSQTIAATPSNLITVLCSNPELKIHEIKDLEKLHEYISVISTPIFEKKVYNATVNSDDTIKVTFKIDIKHILTPDCKIYQSTNTTDVTSEFEFTVDLKNNSVKIEKFTIPSIVEEYRASQREAQENKELKANVKSGNLLDKIKVFFRVILNKILNIISKIKKIFTRKPENTTPKPVVSPSAEIPKARTSSNDNSNNNTENTCQEHRSTSQVQPPEPPRSPRGR